MQFITEPATPSDIDGLIRLVQKYLAFKNCKTELDKLRNGKPLKKRSLWQIINMYFAEGNLVPGFYTYLTKSAASFLAHIHQCDRNQAKLEQLIEWYNQHQMHVDVIKADDQPNNTYVDCRSHYFVWFDDASARETARFLKDAGKTFRYFSDLFLQLNYKIQFDDYGADDLVMDFSETTDSNKVLVLYRHDEAHMQSVMQYAAQVLRGE